MIDNLRNIAIIAHVDHGKTTLVDCLLRQSGTFEARDDVADRIMDSNDLEKERGITITSKNTAIEWRDPDADDVYHINIVDTPGHADFGGEVERVLSMVDSVLLLVDAVDGPMPQTRFVTGKAFELGLNPIVVINKIDRDGARPDWVLNETFDLFDSLGATEDQLDFPVVYTSAIGGYAGMDEDVRDGDMLPLFRTITQNVAAPPVNLDGPFQMQITTLDYNSFVGQIGIGRIARGMIKPATNITIVDREGGTRNARVASVFGFLGLNRVEVDEARAGDIVAITGMNDLDISDTLCDPRQPESLPRLTVDEPTMSMTFEVNKSPMAGKEGNYLTSRQIRERLERELKSNVALRVEEGGDADRFKVSGRGLLHLSVLIETMRREGYELSVSRPEVVTREVDGELQEPYELLMCDVEDDHQGPVIENIQQRRGQMQNLVPDGKGRTRIEFIIPSRGLIGFQTEFMSLTSGTGIVTHVFDHYGKIGNAAIGQRNKGVLIANAPGKAVAFAIFNLQGRGEMMIAPNDEIYEGMVVGIHSRENDLTVNVQKAKQLTNVRAAGTDENIQLTPATRMTLEQALEFINDDELVEVTPSAVRVRKRWLKEHERKKAGRANG
ncbi:GTP-binding protein TypA [Salinisphaera orenii MK-B5]|uniref:Large ribosomal subunit assembly factor BipA n=2 Tax=Salinisphaera orenii TaxID=856731 RepID=A0A423PKS4_9GAMM|nr:MULTISPECIES: translational GTPase TypA [Salinisphaera]ROO23899.1 GTP-binding protein TypA [Salinisphaera halophila YIM 95161]ROO26161.1 GTP-binding protein TypA [Salinisphaera orenii MK-B5]